MPSAPDVLTVGPRPSRAARAYRALRHAAARPFVRLGYFAVVALATVWPLLEKANLLNMYQDSQQHSLFEEAARVSIQRFHELPLWDPYYCGGLYGLGTPSARFVSPPFILTLVFGTLRGAVLTHLLMTVIGLEGAFRYIRARGGGALPAMSAAPIFALSGVFAHATLVAWTNFFGFELVPWTLLGARLAIRGSRRGLCLAALSIGWMVGFGGTYTAPLTVVAVAFEVAGFVVTEARRGRTGLAARLGRIALMSVLVVVLGAAMSMVRLWPVAETLSASPRILGGKPGSTPEWIWRHLFGDKGNHWTKGEFYLGFPILPLLAFGLWRRRAIAPLVGTVLWLWFACGYKVQFSIFEALRTIPPYTMLRAPERFLVFAALAAATITALGVRRLEVAIRRRPVYLLLALVPYGLIVTDTYQLVRLGWIRADARRMEQAPPLVARDFRQDRGNRWMAAYFAWMSRGSLTCFDDYDVAQSPQLRGDLPQEEYLKDKDAGTVKRVRWTPDAIDLQVDLARPARVYVNQNWHPGWRTNTGEVVQEDGLLSLDLPAGSHAVTLSFLPRSAVGGATTSLLALAVVAWLLWRARARSGGDAMSRWRDAGGTAALCVAPFVGVAASLAWMHEPPRPPLPLLTPAGEPMEIDEPPEGATLLAAKWAEGIVLESAQTELEPGDESHGPVLTVELDWRFEQPLPPTLGVFMQFERPGQRFVTDHVLLSGVVVPEAAPLHTLLRDVSEPIFLPENKKETTWQVWAGVWRARRDMAHLRVVEKGGEPVSTDRVLVGTIVVPAVGQPPPRGEPPP